MSIRLRELIRNVRSCKTQADERACIHKECASIRTAFKDENNELRHRNVAKLLFIHMLGYPTHWGQMECLKLIAGSKFLEKRIGYLGLMILLDERQEVLMLVENSLKNDLQSSNQYIAGLACCAIGNISSAEICRDLSPEVEKLMVGSNPFVSKKASLCCIRILRKCPELCDTFLERIGTLLGSRNHAVLLTCLKLMREMCITEPAMIEQLRRHTPTLIAALKNLVLSGYAPEHDVHGIVDPFLQVEILTMLRVLGRGHSETSDQMNDILAQVATNTESAKNAGNAILYECVLTIMAIEVESGLRVLAVNILGRFLINRDNNIRYVALNTLHKVIAQDTQAVQRHRNTIVDCLKDNDSSIRQRALELVYALVNEANVKVLVKELLSYLLACDVEFKDELTQRICTVVEKFSTDKEWHVDTIIQTLSASTSFESEETVCSMIALITSTPELQAYATHKLYAKLADQTNQPVLLQLAVWCVGEYGEMLIGGVPAGVEAEAPDPQTVVELLTSVMRSPVADVTTKEYTINAFVKLTTRFANAPDSLALIHKQLAAYSCSMSLELQQRSVEYSSLLKLDAIRAGVLERMPAFAKKDRQAAAAAAAALAMDGDGPSRGSASELMAAPAVMAAAAPAPPSEMDLLGDILGGSPAPAPAMPAMGGAPAAPPPAAGGMDLLDLLGGGGPPAAAAAPPVDAMAMLGMGGAAPAPPPAAPGSFPPFQAWNKNGLQIEFACTKDASNPSVTAIEASFTSAQPTPLTGFNFQVAVPKYMKLQMSPASSSTVPPSNSGKVTQTFKVANSMHGQKPVLLRIKIDYSAGGQAVSEQGQVDNFPPGI
ncbi:gamma-adaptin [Emiliania huxleyi CCMP1516]|uniref:AP-1 complex subunit gamma n=6 Tax=Noelaerhabdaceae TaxID=418966 RepID=A0A0D3ILM6_EMIH1|nr:gamma-adaptin [Emiliania huxleyi CCMP1516]EOD12161.1 gamma-adaptin [Emiliania huxleyi CCMP1516]|eukprot:XP_005764590.1 gamma-adaptin [Emiliania huxleyi CCMP1516]